MLSICHLFNSSENLLNEVDELIKQTGMKKDKLTIEITESTLMENRHDLINKLHALRSLGIKLAIDDFGTGYSSLAYLKRFPINYLKSIKNLLESLQIILMIYPFQDQL